MRKNLLLAAIALLLSIPSVLAGPAYPGRIIVTQPDGSKIGIRLHGDEFFSWATNDMGMIVEQDENGWWNVTSKSLSDLSPLQKEGDARRAEAAAMRQAKASQSSNFGSPKIPVILVGFHDKDFSKSAQDFEKMLNQAGYSENNAIGSVRDYFTDNSHGQFTPVFEVLGPVQVDQDMSYYGAHSGSNKDVKPEMALVHAAQKLDASVDFTRYDNDSDGTVDFVMFYYAGYDEAQGGGNDCIWSHAWYLSSSSNARDQRTFDNVKLDRYFCTAELKGNSGSTMCSIGTTCHEFSHTLGLPDFYDTDYEKNGSSANMYDFDLMASGSYNGNSTMPPYYTAEELVEVGWLNSIPNISSTGSVTLASVDNYVALKTETSVSGEYFIYEVRRNQKWDTGLPEHGLLVYHVDKSNNTVSGSIRASSVWNSNDVNVYSVHPCCYVVPAANPGQTTEYGGAGYLFGTTYLNYSPTAWNGNSIGYQLTNITYNATTGTVTFNVVNSNVKGISGTVKDSDGYPLSGVSVSAASLSGGQTSMSTTGADGKYTITLDEGGEYRVTASRNGYQTASTTMTVSRIETLNFTLLHEGETLPSELTVFPENATLGNWGTDNVNVWDMLLADLFPSSLMSAYAGKQIKTVTFQAGGYDSFNNCHVVIDFGGERKLALKVTEVNDGDWTTVNVSNYNLIIPTQGDIYVGYGGTFNGTHPFLATNEGDAPGYMSDFSENTVSTATGWDQSNIVFPIKITIGDYIAPDTGYNYIADPKNGLYLAGEVFTLSLVETTGSRKPQSPIVWYMDDELVSAQTVTLTAGSHIIEARFTTTDGSTKVVELPIVVQ